MHTLEYTPTPGQLVVCEIGGTDGQGNRLYAGDHCTITGVFSADQPHDSNGEKAALTVTVDSPHSNPAAYPFRWDAARFYPLVAR